MDEKERVLDYIENYGEDFTRKHITGYSQIVRRRKISPEEIMNANKMYEVNEAKEFRNKIIRQGLDQAMIDYPDAYDKGLKHGVFTEDDIADAVIQYKTDVAQHVFDYMII